MMLASAAVGSDRASTANKTTRLIMLLRFLLGTTLGEASCLNVETFIALRQASPQPFDTSQNMPSTLHMGYQSMLPIALLKTNDLRRHFPPSTESLCKELHIVCECLASSANCKLT